VRAAETGTWSTELTVKPSSSGQRLEEDVHRPGSFVDLLEAEQVGTVSRLVRKSEEYGWIEESVLSVRREYLATTLTDRVEEDIFGVPHSGQLTDASFREVRA
jgi:hypothetical protein